jgi:hypothetical protein
VSAGDTPLKNPTLRTLTTASRRIEMSDKSPTAAVHLDPRPRVVVSVRFRLKFRGMSPADTHARG